MDAIEALVNNIQLTSHIQERVDDWDKSDETLYLLTEVIWLRRNIMKKIEEEFWADHEYRCMVKHAVASRWFLQEVKDATTGRDPLYERAAENMFIILSKFLKQELTNCWRCLLDSIKSNDGLHTMRKEESKNVSED